MSKLLIFILTLILLLAIPRINGNQAEEDEDAEFMKEFEEFCKLQSNIRKNPDRADLNCQNADDFDKKGLRMILVLFLIIAWGAFIRTLLRIFKISFPYTVILMASGLILGIISKYFCKEMYTWTAIARIPPKVILFAFLPVLIFESAFSISVHTFIKSAQQILVLAVPGMLLSTFATAIISQHFLANYNWTFPQASLFGSIISATDPVAVVSILRELGTSEMLSVLIEGESLLNDGFAILLYEIFEKIVSRDALNKIRISEGKDPVHVSAGEMALDIFIQFVRITIGGPVFGFFMGKLTVFCLSKIFNDSTVEITITLAAAYLTYYIGEAVLEVSGVMAVVVLGLVINAEKTAIDDEELVHEFWAMLGHLANTVLFVLVGIVITETAYSNIELSDWFYLGFLYIILNFVRLVMLFILSPWVSRIGYGLNWQNTIIVMWGGLRGAVGICLALEVYENHHLCRNNLLGPKFLFLTAGIVFLTLVVNGTTTKKFLKMLKITEISKGRLHDMENSVKQLQHTQVKTIAMLKSDRFLADADWGVVENYTKITDPYQKIHLQRFTTSTQSLIVIKIEHDNLTECPTCKTMVKNEPTEKEYKEMTEETRLRILKALKVSYWRQFEHGMLIELAVQILSGVVEKAEDIPYYMVHATDIKKYLTIRGFFPWLFKKLSTVHRVCLKPDEIPPPPKAKWRKCFYKIAIQDWFEWVFITLIFLNMIPIIWEMVLEPQVTNPKGQKAIHIFFTINLIFTALYSIEFIIKIIGRGCKNYWTQKWNYLDFIVLIISYITIILYLTVKPDTKKKSDANGFVKIIRLTRVIRALRLIKPIFPKMLQSIDRRINSKLFLGYNVGKGFVTAMEEVLKFLPQMVNNDKVLAQLQEDYPGIALAVKTRLASRGVLNHMRESIIELKEDGLLDEKESKLIILLIIEKMTRLMSIPPSLPNDDD